MSTIFSTSGHLHILHATLYRFSVGAQEQVIRRFRDEPGCGTARCWYDSEADVFEADCAAGDLNICSEALARITDGLITRLVDVEDDEADVTITRIPEAFVHDDTFVADQLNGDATDGEDEEEHNYYIEDDDLIGLELPPQSTPAWVPSDPTLDLRSFATDRTLDELQEITGCALELARNGLKILCLPLETGDEACVKAAMARLSILENNLNYQPSVEHVLKSHRNLNLRLSLEKLGDCEDGTLSRTLVPPAWWPTERADDVRYLANTGTIRYTKYNSLEQRYQKVPRTVVMKSLMSENVLFSDIKYRHLEGTASNDFKQIEEVAALGPANEPQTQEIKNWIEDIPENTQTSSHSTSVSISRDKHKLSGPSSSSRADVEPARTGNLLPFSAPAGPYQGARPPQTAPQVPLSHYRDRQGTNMTFRGKMPVAVVSKNPYEQLLDLSDSENKSESTESSPKRPPGYELRHNADGRAEYPDLTHLPDKDQVEERALPNTVNEESDVIVERQTSEPLEHRIFKRTARKRKPAPFKSKKDHKSLQALQALKDDFEASSKLELPTKHTTKHIPVPTFVSGEACSPSLRRAIEKGFKQARTESSHIDYHFQIGQVLIPNVGEVFEGNEPLDWNTVKEYLGDSMSFTTRSSVFTEAISSNCADQVEIMRLLGITEEAMRHTSTWEVVCVTPDGIECRLTIDALSETEASVESGERLLSAIYYHTPQHVFDLRFVISAKRRTAILGAAVDSVLQSLSTDTGKGPPGLYPELSGRDHIRLNVCAVQLRNKLRYRLPSANTTNHYVEFVRVIEPPIIRPKTDNPADIGLFKTMVLSEAELVADQLLWYEVALGETNPPSALRENEDLELGGVASWSLEEVVDEKLLRSLGELEQVANRLVERMDSVGARNKGVGADYEAKTKRRAEEKRKKENALDSFW